MASNGVSILRFPSIPPYVFNAPDIRSFFVTGSTSTLLKNENDFIFPLASITEFIFFTESNGVAMDVVNTKASSKRSRFSIDISFPEEYLTKPDVTRTASTLFCLKSTTISLLNGVDSFRRPAGYPDVISAVALA